MQSVIVRRLARENKTRGDEQFQFQLDPVSESCRVGAAQNATDQACLYFDLKLPEKDGLLLSSAIAANTSCFLGAFLALTLPYE